MKDLKFKTICLALIVISLLSSGCATIQRAKKVEDLEKEIAQLKLAINEKDVEVTRLLRQLKEQGFSHKGQLEKLRKELNEYRTRLKPLEKKQPGLK